MPRTLITLIACGALLSCTTEREPTTMTADAPSKAWTTPEEPMHLVTEGFEIATSGEDFRMHVSVTALDESLVAGADPYAIVNSTRTATMRMSEHGNVVRINVGRIMRSPSGYPYYETDWTCRHGAWHTDIIAARPFGNPPVTYGAYASGTFDEDDDGKRTELRSALITTIETMRME